MTDRADVVRKMYEVLAAADVRSFTRLLDPDIEWTVPGSHDLAGTFTGVPALLTHLTEVAQRTGGHVSARVDEILDGDRHTMALVQVDMAVAGRNVHDRQVHVFEVRDGRINSVREYHGDERAFDRLFGSG